MGRHPHNGKMIVYMKIKLLLIIFSVLSFSAFALNETAYISNPRVIGIKTHYGFILPHSESIREIAFSNPWGIQIDYAKQLNSQWAWDYLGGYPRVGLSFAYFNFDNPDILGNSYTVGAFFEPYVTFRHRINPSFRFGFGLSYLDNTFNSEKNPINMFYSSPISFFVLANFGLNYRINDLVDLSVASNFSHISNGSIKKPNKGINFPTFSVGLDYKLDKVVLEKRTRQLSKYDIHGDLWRINANFYTSLKQLDVGSKLYQIYGLELTGGRILNRISALHLGIDISHDRSVVDRNRLDIEKIAGFNPTVFSGILSHEFLLGRFIVEKGLAIYLNKPSAFSSKYYQKIGFGYRLDHNLNMGISLKAHRIAADFVSFKVGMNIK
jgi:hypothetical protein